MLFDAIASIKATAYGIQAAATFTGTFIAQNIDLQYHYQVSFRNILEFCSIIDLFMNEH